MVLVVSIIFWQGALGSPMLWGGALRIASSAAKGRMPDADFASTWNLFGASVFRTGHSSLLRANRLFLSRQEFLHAQQIALASTLNNPQ